MATSMVYTYSTQRYDPQLKRQLSSISSLCKASAAFTITTKPSVLTFTGRSTDNHNFSPVLSTISSSNASSSRWHEEYSGGLPISATTRFSEGFPSDNTSEIPFHPSATPGDRPVSKVDEGMRNGDKQQLLERLLSVLQLEAHVPASSASSADCNSEETGTEDYDDQVQRQICLASSLNATIAVASRVRDSTTTLEIPNNTQPPFPLHSHPEYDSVYDESVTSILSSSSLASDSSGYPDGEYSDAPNDVDLDDVIISESSAGPSTNSSTDVTPSNLTSPPSPPPSTSPPIPFTAPNLSGIKTAGLSDIHEEIQAIEVTPKRATSPSSNTRRMPYWDAVSPSTIAPSDGEIRCQTLQNHQCTSSDDIREKPASEVSTGPELTNVVETENEIPSHSLQLARRALSYFQDKKSKHLPPPPPPSPTAPTTRHGLARIKSGIRKLFSVIFPCIPVPPEEEANERQVRGSAPGEGSQATDVRTRSIGRRLTKARQGGSGKGEVKRHSSGVLLEVKVERQTILVADD